MAAGEAWAEVNGRRARLPCDGRRLIDWLRDDLELTGAKPACEQGQCGACSVLVDSAVVLSCCTLAATLSGRKIVTIEGIVATKPPDPLIDAFVGADAAQCGFCTPGMVVAARALLNMKRTQPVTEEEVRRALRGNLCRCSGYVAIVCAVSRASAISIDQTRI